MLSYRHGQSKVRKESRSYDQNLKGEWESRYTYIIRAVC